MTKRINLVALAVLLSAAIMTMGCGKPPQAQGKATQQRSAVQQGFLYVGSANSTVCHYPTCRSAQRISSNNLVKFSSAADAQAKGYRPCKVCRPSEKD